jgi:hypothetical protein
VGTVPLNFCRYNIEPFFLSSSLNWIPSRYQEDLQPGKEDRELLYLCAPLAAEIHFRYHNHTDISAQDGQPWHVSTRPGRNYKR